MRPRRSEEEQQFAVHVRQAAEGQWWTVSLDGEVLGGWPFEFAAVDAGRVNARRFGLPLIVHGGYTSRVEPPLADD